MSEGLRVFVTHTNRDHFQISGRDVPFYKVAKELLEEDLQLDAEIEELDPSPGDLRGQILQKIGTCDYHLIVLTCTSLDRAWVLFEVGAGFGGLGRQIEEFLHNTVSRRIIFMVECRAVFARAPEFYRNWKYVCWDPKRRRHVPYRREGDKTIWRGTFRTPEVRRGLGRLLLDDTFRGFNAHALGHRPMTPEGELPETEYEDWLRAFGAWSPTELFAVSRQPLYYWLSEGREYRDVLRQKIAQGLRLSRLTLWEGIHELVHGGWSARATMNLWQAVGRGGEPSYGCRLCRVLDLLYLFLHRCHEPIGSAYYAFGEAMSGYQWHKRFSELIVYENQYMLWVRFRPRHRISYSLSPKYRGKTAESVKGFVTRIEKSDARSALSAVDREGSEGGNPWLGDSQRFDR
jgi:hypothetical protein